MPAYVLEADVDLSEGCDLRAGADWKVVRLGTRPIADDERELGDRLASGPGRSR